MLRHELGEVISCSSLPVGSYNTALSPAFQLPDQQYSQEQHAVWRAHRSVSGFRKNQAWVSFPAPAIYNRQFQIE